MEKNPDHPAVSLDLLLVNPSLDWRYDQARRIAIRIEQDTPNQESPNIGMGYLVAVAKQAGLAVKYVDMVMDGVSPQELVELVQLTRPRLVGFTAFTIQIKSAAELARRIKEACPETRVCAGGPHANAMPERALAEFPALDFLLTGESEALLVRLVESCHDFEALSRIQGVAVRGRKSLPPVQSTHLDPLPFPAWEEFDLTRYPGLYPHGTQRELPMLTMRGCPYSCTFCCNNLGRVLRRRSIDSILGEIDRNVREFGCESIAFLDETFYLRMDWMQELCDALVHHGFHRKISWSCSTRVSGTSPELFRLMKRAGCYYIFFGFESADEETLKRIKKRTTVEMMRNTVKWTKQAGIVPVGAFIIGLEGASEEESFRAIELGHELDLYSITFPIAVPFPGSPLREVAERGEYGLKILTDDWDHYGKQEPGVMESAGFSIQRRKDVQAIAYREHPKRVMKEYVRRMEEEHGGREAAHDLALVDSHAAHRLSHF